MFLMNVRIGDWRRRPAGHPWQGAGHDTHSRVAVGWGGRGRVRSGGGALPRRSGLRL